MISMDVRGVLLPRGGYDASLCPVCGKTGYARTRRINAAGFLIRHRYCEPCCTKWLTVELCVRWAGKQKGRRRMAAILEKKEDAHE